MSVLFSISEPKSVGHYLNKEFTEEIILIRT